MAQEAESPLSFEESLNELEAVVKELESGDLSLEQALERFERGVELSRACRRQLEEAEKKIEILLKRNDRVEPAPFEPENG
jgi:exodeoxyribonuclease VII small subunit